LGGGAGIEQLGPFRASINTSTGAVSVSVDFIYNGGQNITTLTNYGRIAVFAFCRRSTTPASLSLAASFTELDPSFFFPGETLRASTLTTIEDNINEAILTPEFFGPTTYHNGDTIPLPTSPVDGYSYSRSELTYVFTWSDTTNQTGSHLRLPLFTGNIDKTTGVVTLDVWRLPPGGPYVHDNETLCTVSVIVVAHRQANHGSVTAPGAVVVPTGASSAVVDVSGTPLQVNSSAVPDIGNLNDTLPNAPSGNGINVKWQMDSSVDPAEISAYVQIVATAGIVVDGGGSVPSTGSKGFLQVPFNATIVSWTILADRSGSAQFDVKKSTYSGFPTTSSIVAAAPPSLSAAQKNTSSTLTGWTTAITAGDVLEFLLSSVTTCQRVILELKLTRS
jgi:hypothetical protein